MKAIRNAAATALVLAMLLSTACMSVNDGYSDPVAEELGERMPEITLDEEKSSSLGAGLASIFSLVTTSNADVANREDLRIAVYKVSPRAGFLDFPDAVFNATLRNEGAQLEWERIVRVRGDGEQVWVFAGKDLQAEMLDALCVFILDQA